MASLPWHLPPPGLCVYDVSQGFSHHFGAKSANLHVYDITRCFLHVSKPLRPQFANQVAAQMRCAGKFSSILHHCPRGICHPQCANAGFNATSPGVSSNCHSMLAIFSHGIRIGVRFAGDFTSILPRCLGAIPLPQCNDTAVPLCHGGFQNVLTTCSRKRCMKFEPTCVSQGVSRPFCVVALAPLRSRIAR